MRIMPNIQVWFYRHRVEQDYCIFPEKYHFINATLLKKELKKEGGWEV